LTRIGPALGFGVRCEVSWLGGASRTTEPTDRLAAALLARRTKYPLTGIGKAVYQRHLLVVEQRLVILNDHDDFIVVQGCRLPIQKNSGNASLYVAAVKSQNG